MTGTEMSVRVAALAFVVIAAAATGTPILIHWWGVIAVYWGM